MTKPESTLPTQQKKYRVSLEYCVPCDYHARALQVTKELLGNYQHIIDRLVLITSSKGAFEVRVDDELIFSKKALERHAEPGEILRSFKELVGPQVTPFPR